MRSHYEEVKLLIEECDYEERTDIFHVKNQEHKEIVKNLIENENMVRN